MAQFDHLTHGDVRIPSLQPWGLDLVPAYRVDPATGDEDESWRAEWFAWRDAVLHVRNTIHQRVIADPAFFQEEQERCHADPAWFVTMWLWVDEPRPDKFNVDAQGNMDPYKEFIPFAPQVRLIYLTVAIVEFQGLHDLFISKARGFGVSYVMAAILYWGWLFRQWRSRYLSSKLEKADRTHDLDSLFNKIDLFMRYAPLFIPAGFNRGTNGRAQKHRQAAMFAHPDKNNPAQITAEATTGDSVRGGRAIAVFNDEAAFQEQYRATRATVGGSTNHRIDWSSESFVKGMQWWDTWHTAQRVGEEMKANGHDPVATVIEVDWYENPYQDAEWYRTQKARYESDGVIEEFNTEFLRDPHQHGTQVYPQVKSCPDVEDWYDPTRMLYISVDPGMSDMCAWVFWQTFFPHGKKRVRWLDSFERNRLPAEWYAHVISGILPQRGDGTHPDDVCLPYLDAFDDDEITRLMQWLRAVPTELITIYGDPAMKSQDTGGSSFNKRFMDTSTIITERAGLGPYAGRVIAQPYTAIYRQNRLPDRRFALRKGLMYSEFSLTDGAQQLKEAIERVRFGESTERTSLPPKQRHDRWYHKVSAAEFGMVWDDMTLYADDLKPLTVQKLASPSRPRGRTPTHRQPRAYRDQTRPSAYDQAMSA